MFLKRRHIKNHKAPWHFYSFLKSTESIFHEKKNQNRLTKNPWQVLVAGVSCTDEESRRGCMIPTGWLAAFGHG